VKNINTKSIPKFSVLLQRQYQYLLTSLKTMQRKIVIEENIFEAGIKRKLDKQK
jgi:hypothetical protein